MEKSAYRFARRVGCLLAFALLVFTYVPFSTGDSAAAASAGTINVGSIGSFSGPFASSLGSAKPSLLAWASWVNAHGGVDGHQVNMIVKDDAGDPGTALADAKTLVQQDHVVAIVADASTVDESWVPYIQQQGVPLVGYSVTGFPTNPDVYEISTNTASLIATTFDAAKRTGHTDFGDLYCAESATCNPPSNFNSIGKHYGLNVAYKTSISASSPNFTSQCLAAQQAGVNVMEIEDAVSVVSSVVGDCSKQGYHPVQILGEADPSFLTSSFNGDYVVLYTFGSFQDSTPAQKQYHLAMKTYAPGAIATGGALPPAMWVSGQLFAAAVQAAKPSGTLTSAELKHGLLALHNETVGGLIPPVTFTPGKSPSKYCYFLVGVKDAKYAFPKGDGAFCTGAP